MHGIGYCVTRTGSSLLAFYPILRRLASLSTYPWFFDPVVKSFVAFDEPTNVLWEKIISGHPRMAFVLPPNKEELRAPLVENAFAW
jgi:hypothetical protein